MQLSKENMVIFKKGFLLIELVMGLLLLNFCILFFSVQYHSIAQQKTQSFQKQQQLMLMQEAIEKGRAENNISYTRYEKDGFTIEIKRVQDTVLENFLHIMVTVYDEKLKSDVWHSGFAFLAKK